MSFGASHLIRDLAALSLPEADPNEQAPSEDRVFLSPPSPAQSAVAWLVGSDGLSGAIAEVWVEVDGAWRRAGAAFAVNDPSLSSDTAVPNDARLFARVLATTAGEGAALAVGFRLSTPLTPSALVSSGLVVTSPPLVGDPGLGVYVIGSVSIGIEGLTNVTAALGPADPGLPVRLEIEERIPPLELGRTPVILGTGGEGGQPLGTETAPLAVRGSDGTSFVTLAQEHTREDDPHAVRITDGTAFLDPRQIRQLTLADQATVAQGPAAPLSDPWPVALTDGLALLGTVTDPLAVRPSDGTQLATVTSRISAANSTTTPLAGGATFEGAYEEVAQYATISVQVFADVASAADGLKVEFSTDGTNLDNDDAFTIPAAKGKVFTFGANARFVRVRYVNGASPQAAFRLQTILHHVPPKPSSHKLTVDLVDEDDAELVRAVLAARKPDGTYTNVGADAGGNLIVTTPSQAADGGFIFGRIVLASLTPTALRATAYTEQAANAQRSIVSTSASDTALGTGARAVRIVYFDVAMNGPFEEVVPTNGLTPVNTVATNVCFIERYEVPLGSYGSGLTNAGTLNLKAAAAGGGATIWSIATGDKQAFGAHHYVPPGKSARITGFACGIKGADTAGFEIRQGDPTSSQPAAEVVVSDHLRCPSGAQSPMRLYSSPIEVDGPARLTIYVLPDSTSSRTYYASFDYFDEEG